MHINNNAEPVQLPFDQLIKGETYRDVESGVIYQFVKCPHIAAIVALGEGHLFLSDTIGKSRRFIHCKSVLTVSE